MLNKWATVVVVLMLCCCTSSPATKPPAKTLLASECSSKRSNIKPEILTGSRLELNEAIEQADVIVEGRFVSVERPYLGPVDVIGYNRVWLNHVKSLYGTWNDNLIIFLCVHTYDNESEHIPIYDRRYIFILRHDEDGGFEAVKIVPLTDSSKNSTDKLINEKVKTQEPPSGPAAR